MKNGTLGVLSTAVSGLSNVLVQLLVAALTDTMTFAEFTLISATVLLMLGFGRAVLGQTDMIRGMAVMDSGAVAAAYGLSLSILFLGLAGVGAGLLLGNPTLVFLCYGLLISSVFVLQDALRFRALRMSRAGIALLSDCVVLGCTLSGIYVANQAGVLAETAPAIWSVATLLGLVIAAVPLRYWPRTKVALPWLRRNRDIIGPMTAEYVLQSALPYALNWILLASGGYAALAGYRLIQLIFAAVSNFAQGINAAVLPGIVNSRDGKLAQRRTRYEGFLVAGIAVLVSVVILAVPATTGATIFGSAWLAIGAFALPAAIHGATNALAISNASVLRLMGLARYSLVVRVWTVLLSILFVAIGATFFGPVGAAWGMAVGAIAGFVIRFLKARLVLARVARSGGRIGPATE